MDDGFDDMLPTGSSSSSSSSEQSFLTAEEQSDKSSPYSSSSSSYSSPSPSGEYLNPRQDVVSPLNSSTDFAKMESRFSTDTPSTPAPGAGANWKSAAPKSTSSSAAHEAPRIMTSIEIYDLPGANKYLGLESNSSPPAHSSTDNGGSSSSSPFAQIARPSLLFQNTTEPIKLSTSGSEFGSALPASKFYRRKLSSATAKAESKTV